jgi:hypothetical protein
MKRRTAFLALIIIFLIVFLVRFLISMQTDAFSYDAYFVIRQVENINVHGIPLFQDSLSYSGRVHLFPHVFFYLLSLFSFLGVSLAAKLIPNLFASSLVFAVYLISFHITKSRQISLMTSFFSGFIPIFFSTLNDVSVYSLTVPLTFFLVYYLMKAEKEKAYGMAIFLMVLLVLTHSSTFFLIIGLLIFLILMKVESLEVSRFDKEFILFSSLLALWFNFIIYKKAFMLHGSFVLWQNIPLQILTNYFYDLNIIESIYYIGFLPIIFGLYGIYHVFFKQKRKPVFMLVSLFSSSLILLWLKVIEFDVGLTFMAVTTVLIAGYSIKLAYSYFKKTKINHAAEWFLAAIFILFILTSVIPSLSIGFNSLKNSPSEADIAALNWLEYNTDNSSVILARLEEGFMINQLANRKNVIDKDFLLVKDAQQIYEDVQSSFSLRLKTEALRRLNKYEVDYIYFSGNFGSEEQIYYLGETCFPMVYNESIKIYEVLCSIE